MTLVASLGGVDVAALGYFDVTGMVLEGSGDSQGYGTATLVLSAANGGSFTPVDHMEVQIYEVDGAGHVTWRWFGGFITATEVAPNGIEEITLVHCRDYNEQLDALQTFEAVIIGTTAATSFAARVNEMVGKVQLGAPTQIDAVSGVPDLTPGTTYVHRSWQFTTLRQILTDLCTETVAVNAALNPAFFLGPAATGTTFGPITLNVYDKAATPTPAVKFSTRTADLVTGNYKPLYDPLKRQFDGTQLGTEQIQYNFPPGNGGPVWARVENTTAKARYPNPWSRTNAWPAPLTRNSAATSTADCTTAAGLVVAARAFSRESFPFSTKERVLPGQYVEVTNDDYGLVRVIYPVAAVKVTFANPVSPTCEMTLGARLLELGESGAGALAAPVEGVTRVQTPSSFTQTNVYRPAFGNTRITYTVGVSPLPPAVAGYYIYESTGGYNFIYDLPIGNGLSYIRDANPNNVFTAYAVAYDAQGGLSPPTATLNFTTASVALPTAPGSPAETNVFNGSIGLTDVTYTWTASTPGPGCTITTYQVITVANGVTRTHEVPGTVLQLVDHVPPGATVTATILAFDNYGQVSLPATVAGFTAAPVWAPDAPVLSKPGGDSIFVPTPGQGSILVNITAPGTTHGPHDQYWLRYVGGGITRLRPFPGTATQAAEYNFTPGVTYTVDAFSRAFPAYDGPYSNALTYAIPGLGPPPPGGSNAADAPLYPFVQSLGTATIFRDTGNKYNGLASYSFPAAGADTLELTGLAHDVYASQAWAVKLAYRQRSGTSALTGYYDWDDGTGTWALTSSTLTLPAPTGSFAQKEQQVIAPTGAVQGRLRLRAASLAAAVLLLVLLAAPSPTTSAANYGPGSISDAAIATGGITDSSKMALKTGAGGGYDIYDLNGVLEGRIYGDDTTSSPHSVRFVPEFSNTGLILTDSFGEVLQLGSTGAAGVRLRSTGSGSADIRAGLGNGLTANSDGDNTFTGGQNNQTGTIAAAYTLTAQDHTIFANAAGGAYAVTLPAAPPAGRTYTLYKTDASANAITVTAGAGDTIVGAATYKLNAQFNSVTLEYNAALTTWFVQASH